MTGPNDTPEPIEIEQPAEYDQVEYWLVLPVQGSADPRVVKREPASRPAEFTLRLVLNVPKSTKRLVQTVEVTLPKEFTHLAQIDVAVASKTEGE